MRKTLLFLPVLALLFVACASENTDKAIDYNDKMIAIQSKVDQSRVDLLDAIETFDPVEMEATKIEALDIIKDALKDVESMRDFDNKDDFKKEMTKLLKMYKNITENELSEIIELIGYSDEMTDEDWDNYDQMYEGALDKYDTAFDNFNDWQSDFAKEWKFEVKND